MKLIFSRKDLDPSAGGVPSPMTEGRPLSLPIPTRMPTPITVGDLSEPIPPLIEQPMRSGAGLTYHPLPRWSSSGSLKAAARGQEFVADIATRADALEMARSALCAGEMTIRGHTYVILMDAGSAPICLPHLSKRLKRLDSIIRNKEQVDWPYHVTVGAGQSATYRSLTYFLAASSSFASM